MDNEIIKNKKVSIYILGLLVIGIWGYIIFIVLGKLNESSENSIPREAVVDKKIENLDYYKWKEDLHDDSILFSPFRDSLNSNSIDSKNQTFSPLPVENAPAIDPLAFVQAIDVQYLGYLENQDQGKKIAIIQTNGKQIYLGEGQQSDGIKVLNIKPDLINIKTENQSLSINKQ